MAVALIQVWNVIRATSDNKPIWIAQNLDYEPSSYYLKTNKSSSEDTSSNQHLREELSDIRLEIAEMRAELALLNQQNVDAANMVQHELVSRSDDIPKAGMEMQEMNTEIYSGSASDSTSQPDAKQKPLNILILYPDDWRHDTIGGWLPLCILHFSMN